MIKKQRDNWLLKNGKIRFRHNNMLRIESFHVNLFFAAIITYVIHRTVLSSKPSLVSMTCGINVGVQEMKKIVSMDC